jgi:hypothetical protein
MMSGWAGEAGMCAGFAWAALVNWQLARPWYRRPWMHVGGMVAGYYAFNLATAHEQQTLRNLLQKYERRGYEIPEVRPPFNLWAP